jgi:hypothetical protein
MCIAKKISFHILLSLFQLFPYSKNLPSSNFFIFCQHFKFCTIFFITPLLYSNRSTLPTYKNSHKSNSYTHEQETGECIVHNLVRQDCSLDKLEISCKLQSPTTWMLTSYSPTLKHASHPLSPDLTNLGNNT